MSDSSRKNGGRKPDWEEFYKNGVPREVIVIDDDSPPPTSKPALNNGRSTNGAVRAAKQTKNGGYDPAYVGQASYSATQTPHYDSSSANNTASTDRTQSAYLAQTATTSLGSQASNGIYLPPLDEGMVGQKRKRTRAAAAEELQTSTKRRELERPSPLSINYVPPQKPIVKAKDVPVEVVKDVRGIPAARLKEMTHAEQKSYHKDQKVDDEDGHYIVVPEADLTERCK
jgi:dual-specificity kinase